jgi:hypothetical protein
MYTDPLMHPLLVAKLRMRETKAPRKSEMMVGIDEKIDWADLEAAFVCEGDRLAFP